MVEPINLEISRRLSMWSALLEVSDPDNVLPQVLRQFNFFSGQAGIYRDANKTRKYTDDGTGIAVSLLHTGRHYDDDLSENEIIYHYPETSRIGVTDQNEIQSAKNAAMLGVPIFVITVMGSKRKVQLGKIVSWDDQTKTFLVLFNPQDLFEAVIDRNIDNKPFVAINIKTDAKTVLVKSRPGQPSFKFHVFKRYGPCCAVCDTKVPELLEAAHIIPKKNNGSDDPRNGLVLCGNHHLAFDSGLFMINPDTREIITGGKYPVMALGLIHLNLNHLDNQPHVEALKWRWSEWDN
ncbi:HNH endonuclease [Paenibacillus sp. SER-28]